MSVAPRTPAVDAAGSVTWEQYAALPEDPRLEYIGGRVVVSPSPTGRHQDLCAALLLLLRPVLPVGWNVRLAWAWKPGRDEFIPDVIVFPDTDEDARFTGTPGLCIEVLSTNRRDDLVVKATRYAAAGLGAYWVVDPRDREVVAFELDEDAPVYREAARLSADGTDAPTSAVLTLTLGAVSVAVPLDAAALLLAK